MKRGEVYWADLAPRSGSEQRGRRPVVVISHDALIKHQAGGLLSWSRFPLLWPKPGADLLLSCYLKVPPVSARTVLRSVIK